jgi:hypothetical protein
VKYVQFAHGDALALNVIDNMMGKVPPLDHSIPFSLRD